MRDKAVNATASQGRIEDEVLLPNFVVGLSLYLRFSILPVCSSFSDRERVLCHLGSDSLLLYSVRRGFQFSSRKLQRNNK